MNIKFYLRMAISNLKNNKQMYFPYFFMGSFVIMMSFMIESIVCNHDVNHMPHASNVLMLLNIAFVVIKIFSVIFLFYTNSFLIKRRKKELGLYNILGMEKRHLGIMMFFETFITTIGSLLVGIFFGIVLNKLMFMLLYRLIGVSDLPAFEISPKAVSQTVIMFSVIYFITFLYNLTKVHLAKPIELLHGGEMGEKEPKTKILLTIIGALALGAGYYFALFVESPIQAVQMFLQAVVAVIIGTYALFTAGSIALIKLLRKNKKFYYQAKHFSAVSGMLYRMKQNAVGLASICILSTMVMLSIASSFSMYMGMEDVITTTYPKEINIEVTNLLYGDDTKKVDEVIEKINEENQVEISEYSSMFKQSALVKETEPGVYSFLDKNGFTVFTKKNTIQLMILDLDTYNRMQEEEEQLEAGEVLYYSKNGSEYASLTFQGKESRNYIVKQNLKRQNLSKRLGLEQWESVANCSLMVMPDRSTMEDFLDIYAEPEMKKEYQEYNVQYDTNLGKEESIEYTQKINELTLDNMDIYVNNQHNMRYEFHQMYGSFLFIGILFASIFLMATMIIIYYKQVSEGYEDRERFYIMQKVGMSYAEVRKSIKNQILIVFFLPLLAAGMHVAASFRIMNIILQMMSLGNTSLFFVCTIVTFLAFTAIYACMYAVTAKSYYKIVKRVE